MRLSARALRGLGAATRVVSPSCSSHCSPREMRGRRRGRRPACWAPCGWVVVRPFHESGFMNREIVLRPADAGGPAEIGLFPWNGFVPRIERWQVTSQGVPFLAGYISTQGNPQKALWTDVDGDGVADLVCIETTASSTFAEVI